ncbi:hypothetical protein [Methanosarcina sp.]|uniref:hypothetical protein n=1 Tax=Methanosarcina sp. TaxID=2213 RepID=UPI003C766747
MSPRDDYQNQNKQCTEPVTCLNPEIVETFKKIVSSHKETLDYLSKFGTITERAKANLIFEIAAGGA